ncbi:MAG: hypothetical protein GXX85_06510 [Ignavibacteria bacterium]|nr:hypothetical protein [Ignavibacteria bacterium]
MRVLFFALVVFILQACSSVILEPADFSWPAEVVMSADNDGNVFEKRYSMTFNIKPLIKAEFGDSVSAAGKEIRLIRNKNGFYFIVSKNFKNVYTFLMKDGKLKSSGKIEISETGIESPAFNQRNNFIELLTGKQNFNLTEEGIEEKKNE